MSKRFYAVWGGDGSLPPGVYYCDWETELRRKVERPGFKFKRVGSRREGLQVLADNGHGEFRHLLDKAVVLHHRCWYCARPLDPESISEDDSTELEHQVPRSIDIKKWPHVNRVENLVASCRKCNNGCHPGKGDRDVQAFRELLQQEFKVRRVVFYGEVLRWLRAVSSDLDLPAPLTEAHVREVLGWYARSEGLKLHTWREDGSIQDYQTGLLLPIPADVPPYALGAPHRLPPDPPRALGPQVLDDDPYDISF